MVGSVARALLALVGGGWIALSALRGTPGQDRAPMGRIGQPIEIATADAFRVCGERPGDLGVVERHLFRGHFVRRA